MTIAELGTLGIKVFAIGAMAVFGWLFLQDAYNKTKKNQTPPKTKETIIDLPRLK